MKNYLISFVALFIIILSYVLYNKSTEENSSLPIPSKINHSKINTVKTKKPSTEITKALDAVVPTSELKDLMTSRFVPTTYFHDWSDDERIEDILVDT